IRIRSISSTRPLELFLRPQLAAVAAGALAAVGGTGRLAAAADLLISDHSSICSRAP
ncbi:hypothetical protein B0H12DRAFT_1143888, partial [Mycena haematopus]